MCWGGISQFPSVSPSVTDIDSNKTVLCFPLCPCLSGVDCVTNRTSKKKKRIHQNNPLFLLLRTQWVFQNVAMNAEI